MEETFKNMKRDTKRFHLRFYDTKIIWECFSSKASAVMYLLGMNFIKKDMEIYDTKIESVVYYFK